MTPELAALIGVGGALLGATVQFFFGRITKREGVRIDQKVSAYTDYLKARMASAKEGDDEMYAVLGAQARIAMYASSDVIRAFAAFERAGGLVITDEQKAAFVRLLASMRRDCGSEVAESKDMLVFFLPEEPDAEPGAAADGPAKPGPLLS